MQDDKQLIRALVDTWLSASAAGDVDQVLQLMAEDVVFLIPGQPPMRGREAFAAGFKSVVQQFRMEARSDIQEIEVAGDWAYCWNHLTVTMSPLGGGGSAMHRSGYTLSILRKHAGRWVIVRDANLLAPS
jgi:uncharacterized protein (TIGR02246 family)